MEPPYSREDATIFSPGCTKTDWYYDARNYNTRE